VDNTEQNTDKRLKNLKAPWKPGQTGNPNGRPPKRHCVSSLLNEDLPKLSGKERQTLAERLKKKIIEMALKGDKWALETILDRTEGKALERVLQGDLVKEDIIIE
jgi:hypothetical protein